MSTAPPVPHSQAPQRPGEAAPPPGLLAWPHQLPSEAAQALADAHFIRGLELGPPAWYQAFHQRRAGELMAWLSQSAAWRQWFGPLPASIAFEQLPVMRREDYRALTEAEPPRVPASHGPLYQYDTSGSTGVPVQFWYSALAGRINRNHYWADHARQGRDLRAELATISGKPGTHDDSHMEHGGDPWLHPGRQLARHSPSFSIEEHAHWLCTHAPAYLVTYPALLSGMLSVIERKGLRAPSVQQVLTFAETVEPELRERARRVLGARIADRYSCEELGPLAFQCPVSDAHYHVAVSNVLLEVVDDAGTPLPFGQEGSVLATGLHQWASAGVRYELGDVARLLPRCPACAATAPTLTGLLGRKRTLVQAPGGELRYVRVISEHWLACAPVREHRLVQTAPLAFRVELVVNGGIDATRHAALLRMLRERIGPEFAFDIQALDAIPWPPGRKRQEVVGLAARSEVPR